MYKNEMKKKIIFFMPSFEGGGVEKNIIIIANELISRNFEISLITASREIKKKFSNKINLICPLGNFWNKFGRPIKYLVCSFLLITAFFKYKKFNVFCFQGNFICILICKILGLKILIRPNSSPSGWSKNFLKKFFFKQLFRLSDKIVVNSLVFKKEFKKKFNLQSNCIYNPLNKKEILNLSKKKVFFNFFKKDTVNLISIGRIVKQKDHISILKSINFLKDKLKIKLLIIGEGDQNSELKNFIDDNNLNTIVKIKNRIENPFPYLAKADVFVLSSHYEGLPNVLLEAIALNKFVISSNCLTGPKEILDNGKGGLLFKVGDHYDLSKKILFYKNNPKICKNKKKFAFFRLSRFDLKKMLIIIFNYLEKFRFNLLVSKVFFFGTNQ